MDRAKICDSFRFSGSAEGKASDCLGYIIMDSFIPLGIILTLGLFTLIRHLRWRLRHLNSIYLPVDDEIHDNHEEEEARREGWDAAEHDYFWKIYSVKIQNPARGTLWGILGFSIILSASFACEIILALDSEMKKHESKRWVEVYRLMSAASNCFGWLLSCVLVSLIATSSPLPIISTSSLRRSFRKHAWTSMQYLCVFFFTAFIASCVVLHSEINSIPSGSTFTAVVQSIGFSVLHVMANFIVIVLAVLYITNQKELLDLETRTRRRLPNGRYQTKEKSASIFSKLTFGWFSEFVDIGEQKNLGFDDIWELREDDQAAHVCGQYEKTRYQYDSLIKRLFIIVRLNLAYQAFFALMSAILSFSGPFFLNRILSFVQQPSSTSYWIAFLYVVGLFSFSSIRAICDGQTYFNGRRIGTRIRAVIIGEIYAKALRRVNKSSSSLDVKEVKSTTSSASQSGNSSRRGSDGITGSSATAAPHHKPHTFGDSALTEVHESASTGEIVNLMAVDTQKVLEVSCYIHYIWSTPFQAVICIFLLVQVLGWPAFAGVIWMLLMVPIGGKMGRAVQRAQKRYMRSADSRMRGVNEILHAIRIIKLLAWESHFLKSLSALRDKELNNLKSYLFTSYISRIAWASTPILVSFVSFMTYTVFAGKTLDAPTAFTALALFNTLRHPLQTFPDIIVRIMEALVSIGRVEKFLAEEELEKYIIEEQKEKVRRAFGTSEGSDVNFGGFEREREKKGQLTVENGPTSSTLNVNGLYAYYDDSFQTSQEDLADSSLCSTLVNGSDSGQFVLRDIDIRFPIGKLSVIIGTTGAGKTSLLLSILGEMKRVVGEYDSRVGGFQSFGVAYVAQQAWLQNATIRDNILFSEEFDEKRYFEAIQACALVKDMEILEGGDKTEIGEKGVNLSGGQKQRIALCRAAYSSSPIVFLDDPLSAVDAPTGRHLFEQCIVNLMMKKQKRTVVLVTHAVGLCFKKADYVVVLKDGQIISQGSPFEVEKSGLVKDVIEAERKGEEEHQRQQSEQSTSGNDLNNQLKSPAVIEAMLDSKEGTRLINDEQRAVGSVQLSVYKKYVWAAGGIKFFIVLLLAFWATQSSVVTQDYWIKTWVNSYKVQPGVPSKNVSVEHPVHEHAAHLFSLTSFQEGLSPVDGIAHLYYSNEVKPVDGISAMENVAQPDHNTNFYVLVYLAIGLSTIFSLFSRLTIQAFGSLRASRVMHNALVHKLMRAPVRFFDTTPMGRIMNRCGKDVQSLDQDIMGFCGDTMQNLWSLLAILIVVIVSTPVVLIGIIPVAFVASSLAKRYLRTSRELKRLDSTSRSPIYSHFAETLIGVSTIRAYGAEGRFVKENFDRIDFNHRAFFFLWVSNRWLSVRVDFIGAMVALFAGLAIILSTIFNFGMNAGLAGMCLSYALMFTDSLLWLVRMHALVEMNMNSVERIEEYLEVQEEAPEVIPSHRPPPDWPMNGNIEVRDLVMSYSPDLPPVIRDVSFRIKGGEKIAIVGRTGAGKSSLVQALFRMMEPDSGTIIIDGIDICTIGVQDLRSRLTIIPQDPVLFRGTVRSNLDIFGEHDDGKIWEAIRRVGLTGVQLDASVHDHGSNFSQGQRQLLCLARALLRNTKIVVLDEPTSSVDHETDAHIQEAIRSECRTSTVICIAHRLRTVADFDRVVVMDKGKVVEIGTPFELMMKGKEALQNKKGDDVFFWKMCLESGEVDKLYDIAKNAVEKQHRQKMAGRQSSGNLMTW